MTKILVILSLTFASVLSINMMTIETNPIDSSTDTLQSQIEKAPNNLQLSNQTGPGIT